MTLLPTPPLRFKGVKSDWLASLPDSGTEMLTISSTGVVSRQAIPVASFGALTGSPSDNAALQSALNAKLNLSGGTMTGKITATATGNLNGGIGNGNTGIDFFNGLITYLNNSGGVLYPSYFTVNGGVPRLKLSSHSLLGWGSSTDASVDANIDTTLTRNTTGQLDFRGDNGLRLRNLANNAFSDLQARTGTFNTNLNLSGAGSTVAPASFGLAVYRNDNGQFQWGHSYSQGFLISHNNASFGFTNHPDSAPDARIVRNATGPAIQTQAAGGLQVRGSGGSGDAPFTASLGTFSTGIDVGADFGTTQPRIRFGTTNPSSIGSNYGNIEFRTGSGTHPSVGYTTRLIIDTTGATRIGENIPIQWRNGDPNGGATLGFITVSGSPSQVMQLNANGSVMVQSNGGLAVKNQANSAWTDLQCKTVISNPGQTNSQSFGSGNTMVGTGVTLIGTNVNQSYSSSTIGIGYNVNAVGRNSVYIGNSNTAPTPGSVVANVISIGDAVTTGTASISIGSQSSASQFSTVVGYLASDGDGGVAIGKSAVCTLSQPIAIGNTATATVRGIAIGYIANAGTRSIALGQNTVAYQDSIAIGNTAVTTAVGQLHFGSSAGPISTVSFPGASFNRINLGDATASNPAIKRSGTAINFRLADDSADCNIAAAQGNFSSHLTSGMQTLVADPSTVDITTGLNRMVKNSTSGEVRHWVNDGGTMKSVLFS